MIVVLKPHFILLSDFDDLTYDFNFVQQIGWFFTCLSDYAAVLIIKCLLLEPCLDNQLILHLIA
jgi:hypothetical protein